MTAAELKASILDLAVRGQLVPQREEERFEKFEGFERFEKSTVDDPPYELPRNWVWKRLGEVCHIERGGSPRPINAYLTTASNGINWIKIGDTEQGGKYIVTAAEKIKPEGLNKTRLVEPGDFLLTNSMSFGRPYICKIHGAIHDGWLRLHFAEHTFDETYLFWLLSSPFVFRQFNYLASGSGVRNLKIEKAAVVIIPLPPLPEQKRIVAKIEELLPLVEEYGEAQKELEALNADFPAALRESILQDAVQGKLTAEWRRERFEKFETARDLLDQIAAEKKRLLATKKIKNEKPLPPIADDEKPFEIPDTWAWCRLGDVLIGTSAGKSPQCNDEAASGDDWGVIKTTAIQDGYFLANENKKLPVAFVVHPNYVIHKNDLLITRAGPKNRTGISCVVTDNPGNLILSDKTVRLDYFDGLTFPRYLVVAMRSPLVYLEIMKFATGMAESQVNISQGSMKLFLIPIPPLAEQKAIIERVDELLKIVDAMKAQ